MRYSTKKTGKKTKAATALRAKGVRAKRQRIEPNRARVLEQKQLDTLFAKVRAGRNPIRDEAMLCLSYYCGLRAMEIAGLQWQRHILDAEGKIGNVLHITSNIAKRSIAREIPMNRETQSALKRLKHHREAEGYRDHRADRFVIHALFGTYANSARGQELSRGQCDPNTITQYLRRLYKETGYVGCTSHSGRRTFGTMLARRCNEVNNSIRDVQVLMGHASLESTMPYVEVSKRQHALVNLLGH